MIDWLCDCQTRHWLLFGMSDGSTGLARLCDECDQLIPPHRESPAHPRPTAKAAKAIRNTPGAVLPA